MKRFLALATAAAVSFTMLCACGKKENAEDEIYIPIRTGNKTNYNTAFPYKGTILEQVVIDAQFENPYYTDLAFTMMDGTIQSINVRRDQDVKEGDVIATLKSDALEDDIIVQKLKLDSAQSTYDILSKSGSKSEAEFAKIDLEIEQAKYDDLVKRREFLVIKAPYDGRISYVGNYWPGATVRKNATICTIVDTNRVCLSAVDNGQLENIGFGANVEINQGAIANTTGKVVDVVTEEFSGNFGGGNHTYTLNKFIIKPDEDVKFENFGTIQVTFTTLRRDDAIIVPSNAVFEFGNGHAVNVLIDSVKIQTNVTVGIVSGDKTEILTGLDGTETLIV